MVKEIRRKDRALDKASAYALLKSCEYGVLSTADKDNRPYGIPVNYAVMDNFIVIHCATEGHKLENIRSNPKVSFCAVGRTRVLPDQFSTRYESAVVFGTASIVNAEKQKRAALKALLSKYAPDHLEAGEQYVDKQINRASVIRISIDHLTGKART